jgi:Homeodomain-like domain
VSGRRRATAPEVMRAVGLRKRGWKLIDIAAEIGVSEASVSRWVRGISRAVAGGQSGTGRLVTLPAAREPMRFRGLRDPDGRRRPSPFRK